MGFEKVLSVVNNVPLTEILVGFTGVVIAVIVFISGIIVRQEHNLLKKAIISVTKLKRMIILITAGYCLLMVTYIFNGLSHSALSVVLAIIEICLMTTTLRSMFSIIKINTDEAFYYGRIKEQFYKTAEKTDKEQLKWHDLNTRIENMLPKYKAITFDSTEEDCFDGVPICASSGGLLKNIKCSYLKEANRRIIYEQGISDKKNTMMLGSKAP